MTISHLSIETQAHIRKAGTKFADRYCSDPVSACRGALRSTRLLPAGERLEAINHLLNMHGTEGIRGEWQNGYWGDVVAAYCNAGDTYDVTVIEVRGETSFRASRFIVSTLGDFVERNSARLAIV